MWTECQIDLPNLSLTLVLTVRIPQDTLLIDD
jgi:hypothetical protein